MTPRDYYDPLESLDADLPYPEWMEEDLFDRSEAAYNESLMDGGDL